MKALVTGGSGFVGSTMAGHLHRAGFDVRVLLRPTSRLNFLEGLPFEKAMGSLSDEASLAKALEGVNYIFHFAGVVAGARPKDFFEPNAEGTRRLIQAAKSAAPDLKRFVFISSLAAGGPMRDLQPRTEMHADQPVSDYGRSKLQAEQYVLRHRKEIPVLIIRPPIVYGPRDSEFFRIIKGIQKNFMPLLSGSNAQRMKYYSVVFVDDLCRGILDLALQPEDRVASGEVFYLTHSEILTFKEILSTIALQLKRKPLQFSVPPFLVRSAAKVVTAYGKFTGRPQIFNNDKVNEILADYWICSPEKARQACGFNAGTGFSEGIARAIEWYRRQRWLPPA